MKSYRPKGSLERGAAANLWRNTLSQIPSVFGRLVYLSSLRDQNTGRYEHHGMAQVFGEDEADEALRASHLQSFADWLCFSLEQQKADLDLYLAAFGTNKKTILETWIRLAPYRNLVPAKAQEVERRLYLTDLEALLEILKREYDVSYPDPDA
jgi:hypothetical protein